jgi:uncharacterized SAM-dependent methyltransferase
MHDMKNPDVSRRMPHEFPQPSAVDPDSKFACDLIMGLSRAPRSVPPKYFYDAAGSALFDAICELPEYYPTRTELRILSERGPEIAAQIGSDAELVEFGAGSLTKVRLLFDAFDAGHAPKRYLPIDISGVHLESAADRLRADYPHLTVQPVVADYTMPLVLPAPGSGLGQRVGFFPGSAIFIPMKRCRFSSWLPACCVAAACWSASIS